MTFATEGDFAARVRASFDRQRVMETFGAKMTEVEAGRTVIEMTFDEALTQQHGFLHAGVVTACMDSAAGFAAMSLMPKAASVLTVELKASLLRPAAGERFRFVGEVIKPGRSILFTEARAFAFDGAQEREIARLSASMIVIEGRDGIEG